MLITTPCRQTAQPTAEMASVCHKNQSSSCAVSGIPTPAWLQAKARTAAQQMLMSELRAPPLLSSRCILCKVWQSCFTCHCHTDQGQQPHRSNVCTSQAQSAPHAVSCTCFSSRLFPPRSLSQIRTFLTIPRCTQWCTGSVDAARA